MVLEQLQTAFAEAVSQQLPVLQHATCHRWRYAIPEPLDSTYLYDPDQRLAACGDWCGGPRVEGAFLSGSALAERIVKDRI